MNVNYTYYNPLRNGFIAKLFFDHFSEVLQVNLNMFECDVARSTVRGLR